jgi:putative Ca2+/H+ antiporter (TMEM165/GDT1 family)
MAAFLTAFVAAFLCAWGDRTQLLAATLVSGTKRPGQVLAGLTLAALAGNVVAAFAGIWIAGSITIRAMTLLTALALLFGGLFGLFPRKQKPESTPRWLVLATFILCLAAEMGDRTQFLTFALAGRFASAP